MHRMMVFVASSALVFGLAVSISAQSKKGQPKAAAGAPETIVYDAQSAMAFLTTTGGNWGAASGQHEHGGDEAALWGLGDDVSVADGRHGDDRPPEGVVEPVDTRVDERLEHRRHDRENDRHGRDQADGTDDRQSRDAALQSLFDERFHVVQFARAAPLPSVSGRFGSIPTRAPSRRRASRRRAPSGRRPRRRAGAPRSHRPDGSRARRSRRRPRR